GEGITRIGSDKISVRVANNVKPLDGYHDVVVHAGMYDDNAMFNVDGQWTGSGQIAEAIKSNPSFVDGQKIRMLVCYGGCGPAQEVADITGSEILAADSRVSVVRVPGSEAQVENGGSWITFRPRW